jgi:hypothetical protein
MSILIPGMDNNYNREDFLLRTESDSLSEAWRKIESSLKPPTSSPSTANTPSPSPSATSANLHKQHQQQPIIKKQGSLDWAASKSAAKSKLSSIKRSLFHFNSSSSSSHQASQAAVISEETTAAKLNNNGNELNDAHSSDESNLNVQQQPSVNGHGESRHQPLQQSLSSSSSTKSSTPPTPSANVVKLINKPPDWHPELKSFALDFNGRVTLASSKNFQVAHEANTSYVVMQFGKVNRDLFTCDYSYPVRYTILFRNYEKFSIFINFSNNFFKFCALQAFGVALSSLEDKLGCD